MDEQQQPDKGYGKGYGKRSMKQWIVIYLILAIVVYGLAYLIFFRKSGGTGY